MASVSTLSFFKSRLYTKSRLFHVKFQFGHMISFLKSRLYVKSRFVKSRLYCIRASPCTLFFKKITPTKLGEEGLVSE